MLFWNAILRNVPDVLPLLVILWALSHLPRGSLNRGTFVSRILGECTDATLSDNEAEAVLSALETRLQSSIGGEIDGFSVSMLCENYCRKNGFPGFALHTRDVICFQVLNSCGGALPEVEQRRRGMHYTFSEGIRTVIIYSKHCKVCKAVHYPHFWIDSMNGRHFHPVGENSTFMATNSTVFDVELLLDAERNFRYNHASFRGESRKYNDRAEARHGPLPFADLLNRKRLAEAYFRFILVNYLSENGELPHVAMGDNCHLDNDLDRFVTSYAKDFTIRWGRYHQCTVPGCRTVAIGDGHVKCRRSICANKLRNVSVQCLGIKDGSMQRGCTRTPAPGSTLCVECRKNERDEHQGVPNAQAPCNTSLPIRSLRPRKTASVDCDDEEVFEVSHLEGFVNEDGVYMYYVRWAPPYSHECTLEPLDNIFDAGLIVAFHRRDRSPIPEPVARVPHVKRYLSRNKISPSSPWSTGIELHAHRGGLGTLSIDESDTLTDLNCNTEKDNIPTQVKDRTAGVFNVSWACGISIGIGELFGSESISQVYATLIYVWLLIEFVPPYFGYDDACHLSRFVLNPKRFYAENSSRLQCFFARTRFFVDRLHIKNHVDEWCQQHMTLGDGELVGVNTQVCEELFSWLCGFKHIVRHFNQSRFLFYIIRMLHLHNQSREKELAQQKKLCHSGTFANLAEDKPLSPPRCNVRSALYMSARAAEIAKKELPPGTSDEELFKIAAHTAMDTC